MNNLLIQKWCLCLNVQNRIRLSRAKNHKFGDETTVCEIKKVNWESQPMNKERCYLINECASFV